MQALQKRRPWATRVVSHQSRVSPLRQFQDPPSRRHRRAQSASVAAHPFQQRRAEPKFDCIAAISPGSTSARSEPIVESGRDAGGEPPDDLVHPARERCANSSFDPK